MLTIQLQYRLIVQYLLVMFLYVQYMNPEITSTMDGYLAYLKNSVFLFPMSKQYLDKGNMFPKLINIIEEN